MPWEDIPIEAPRVSSGWSTSDGDGDLNHEKWVISWDLTGKHGDFMGFK
jgi:hypothetical protein